MALCPQNMMFPTPAAACTIDQSVGLRPMLVCIYVGCQTGRRPEGLAAPEAGARDTGANDPVGRYLAQMAWLEAASVPAFERLTRELAAHGAPRRLLDASRDAAGDETRHARAMSALAAQAGAAVAAPRVEARALRSLEEIAIENAVEGCVRETFGAAVAAVQAKRAGDARFRAAMRGIARDEARHARLSWDVAAWLDRRLDADARQRVKAARERAAEELLREVTAEPDGTLTGRLGVPSSREARAMVRSLRAALWS
jgi:hypothetical protein